MLVLEGTKRVSLWAPTAGVIEQLGASPGGAFRYTAVARPKGPPRMGISGGLKGC